MSSRPALPASRRPRRLSLVAGIGLLLALTGCGTAERISNIGQAPELTPIQNPVQVASYQPVSLPMPAPEVAERQPASLWRPGSRAFFRDQRAHRVGDILTVTIDINDSAEIRNQTSRSRTTGQAAALNALFGYEADLHQVLPDTVNPANLADYDSSANHSGAGRVDREEEISLRVAALVTQVLPNGNLVIQGRQEVRVNFELRELLISGVIRPEDISANNTVRYDQIAEARISYGGRGQLTDVQQPRYGDQLFDIIMPF
jgi:flagellar L-ring protein precursor FlgH